MEKFPAWMEIPCVLTCRIWEEAEGGRHTPGEALGLCLTQLGHRALYSLGHHPPTAAGLGEADSGVCRWK